MKKNNYESPEFKFNEMKLMERVADTCWGHGTVYYDADNTGTLTPDDIAFDIAGGGCQGKATSDYINIILEARDWPKRVDPKAANTKVGFINVPGKKS